MNVKALAGAVVVALGLWLSLPLHAQQLKENFNSTKTQNYWHPFSGACLTAGTRSAADALANQQIPGCTGLLSTYFNLPRNNGSTKGDNNNLVGGAFGYLGSTTAGLPVKPDPDLSGALRLTNGHIANDTNVGYFESGAIVSDATFPTAGGVQITFKTVTYSGDSGGSGKDGADGISFYLMDGCMPVTGVTSLDSNCTANQIYGTSGGSVPPPATFPGIGSNGGSLAYSCSNSNTPFDGLVGAYLGLGIDEYGNFLNGVNNTLGETGSTSNSGDNTASGGAYQPGRIGLRGAGSVSWQALTTAYGTVATGMPYYPASMATSCPSGGTYIAANNNCASCSSGTLDTSGGATNNSCINQCQSGTVFSSKNNMCNSCSVGTYNGATNNQCVNVCTTGTYVPGSGCAVCSKGNYNAGNNSCSRSGTLTFRSATTTNPVTAMPTTSGYSAGLTLAQSAVQNACRTGHLYSYASNQTTGTDLGAMVLGATYNPAGILDYDAMAFNVPTSFQIANEAATRRSDALPIVYSLKITQDGFLTLDYSVNGGASMNVINNTNIIQSNGQLPNSFRFGFAGSTGGSTNVHEILCFKAAPSQVGNGSGGVTVYQDPTLKIGAEQFVASYFPSDWTGSLTATPILFDKSLKALVLANAPVWDAGCVLTGGACSSTGAASGTAQTPASRVMLTWDGSTGVPFEWANLSSTQQAALNAGDSQGSNRLDYLRGVRTHEINIATGAGLFRTRDKVLGDIINSSPSWVGPPGQSYSATTWVDQIHTTTTAPENASGAQKYADYQTSKQGRLNVVYAGANDGFLHGFRAGTLDAQGNQVAAATAPNDGAEVLAYMPALVVNNIHPKDSTGVVIPTLDYSNTHYAHAYYVDATPATGDVFFNKAWHTWVVGGLGAGGAAIYALDVTDPSTFTEGNAKNIVVGEWTPGNITCANAAAVGACGPALGNTFGTPEIRRFHNGQWGAIIGNGYGALDASGYAGAAGIYIMLIDSSGKTSFYYLPAAAATKTGLPNGISSATSLDLDLDHVVDYIYAGDLLGNVWRFDVTGTDPKTWIARSTPLFTAPYTPAVTATGTTPAFPAAPSPITTRIVVGTLKSIGTSTNGSGSVVINNAPERVILDFGTGQQTPQTLTAATQYSQGPHYLYGIWDWDFGANTSPAAGTWNALSSVQKAISLTGPQTITAPPTTSNLQKQVITINATTPVTESVTHNVVCWLGDTACGSGQTMLGWYAQLPHTREQTVFDPVLSPDGALVVTTYVPLSSSILDCTDGTASSFTLGIDAQTGGGLPVAFFNVGGQAVDGVQLNGTGSPSFLSSGQSADQNAEYLLTQTIAGTAATPQQVNRRAIVTGQRMNWIQRR